MKKLIIWGASGEYANYREVLFFLQEKGMMTIQAIIDRKLSQMGIASLDNFKVISTEELPEYDYDCILIAANYEASESIIKELVILQIPESKYMMVSKFVDEYEIAKLFYEKEREVQIQIIEEILNAKDDELENYEWMLERVCRFGIRCFSMEWMKKTSIHWSANGILQIPEEFASLCCLLAKQRIATALEVGVFRGLSSYFMCAVLTRINPSVKYIMVDINDMLVDYDRFFELLPTIKKCIPSTSNDFKGKVFDFVFIDADHSYDASILDWNNVGKYSSVLTVFHDIYAHEYDGENGGTVRTWKEIVQDVKNLKVVEFAEYPNERMGIGCVLHQ